MSLVELSEQPDGVVLPVKARPGARRNAIDGVHAGALKVSVAQAAEKGKANAAIIALLAKEIGVSKSEIQLSSGATNSQKKFLVKGISAKELANRLDEIIGADE